MTQPIINCDWLQIHVDTRKLNRQQKVYELRTLEGVRTRTFSEVIDIYYSGRPVGTLQHKPFSPRIPEGCGVLKIENYILYCRDRQAIISDIIKTLALTTLGTTRIDIAGDFQEIGGRLPEQLVSDLLTGKLRKVGHARQSIIGQEEVTAYGRKEWQYLRYGSRSSRITAYLYDKTRELTEEHDKPYIRAIWKANGFATKKRHTWRLEFSIKGRDMSFISTETGEVLPQYWQYWLDGSCMRDIYRALCVHYFNIALNDHARPRCCTPLPLWKDYGKSDILVKYLEPTRHNNRSDKILLKKLLTLSEEVYDAELLALASATATKFAEVKHLTAWARLNNLTPYLYDELQIQTSANDA